MLCAKYVHTFAHNKTTGRTGDLNKLYFFLILIIWIKGGQSIGRRKLMGARPKDEGGKIMANTLVQFRAEETSRIKAASICEKLGIDLATYLRMCISRLVQENGIPFSMKVNEISENPGVKAMKEASRIAAAEGIADMTPDEINAEISDSK